MRKESPSDHSETFLFSGPWTVRSAVLHLSAGFMVVKNITYLVADHSTSCEDLLIAFLALPPISVDARKLLECNKPFFHGTYYTLDATDTLKAGELEQFMAV